ncbi:hypothetical protein DFJ73DRAFT_564924 [Zopfochytrium polystomum]|nr:hypothetical protein DFJ73DRAFT_564924 [Zopfochytrium polystomum]
MPEEEQQQPAAEHHPAVSTLRTPPSPTPATDTTTTTTNVTSYPASSSTAARTMASAPAAAAATTDSVQSALSSLFARPPTAGAATRESASSSATTVGAAAPAIEPTTPGPMRQRALGPASAASSSSGSLPASADASTGSTASASTPPTSLSSSSPSTRGDERLGVSSSWYTPLQESLPTMQASLPTGLSAAAAGKRPAHMCFADEDDALVGDVDSRLHLPRYPGHGGDFPMLEYSFARLSRRSFSTTSGDSRKCGLLSLPTEILMAIFEHTWSQKSLHELSLVCRALHASVAPFLYRFPRFIDTFSWAQFVLSITRQRNWRCGAYVQVLNLCITHGNSSVRTTSFQLHPVLSSLRLNPAAQARLPVELRLLETNTLPEDDAALADHFVPVVHRNTSIVGSASDAPAYKHQRHVVARTSSMPLDAMVVMESAGTGAAESATAVAADPRPREDVAVGQYNDRNMLLEFLESIEEHDERRRLAAMLLDHSLDEEGLLAFSVLRERMRRRSEHMRFMSRDAGRDIADDDFLLASALSAFESGRDREHWLFASAGQQEGAGLASNQPTPTATNGPSSPSSSHSFVNSVVSSSRTSSASMSGFRTSSSPTPSSSPPFFMSPAFPFSASSMGSDSSHREHDRSQTPAAFWFQSLAFISFVVPFS